MNLRSDSTEKTRQVRKLSICLLVVFLVSLVPAFSDILDDTEIVPGIRFWGADLEFRYKGIKLIQPLVTRFCFLIGSGYEDPGYFRNPDGSEYTPPIDYVNDLSIYKRFNLTWGVGVRQGILFDQRKNDNLLEAHLLLRGRYDKDIESASIPGSLIFQSGLPDKNEMLQNSIVAGAFFNTIVIHPKQRKRTGISADMSVEYAPKFLANDLIGKADFSRFTFDFRTFQTIFDIPPDNPNDNNLFNAYLCNRIVFDALFGPGIPINARQSIGGRSMAPTNAVGYSVRGIDDRRFDSYLKFIINTDLRLNLHSIPLFDMVPGAIFFFDIATFDNLDYSMTLSNLKYTTGIGFFVYVFGFEPVVYLSYFLNENRFLFSFDFSLQF
jgi:hypothetical protein